MKVFVTGASGFVGSAVVKELLQHGHTVLGLARSEQSANALTEMGAEVHRGDIYDLESLKSGARICEAVIHTAFNHDFSNFKENCETDRGVIKALGSALEGTGKPLVITSGIGLMRQPSIIVESDSVPPSTVIPRAASEEASKEVAAMGVDVYVVRLPPTVHGEGDHGFVPMIIGMAKAKGESVYIDEGSNRWPAVHRSDAASLYRLIIEQRPSQKVLHAVAESGIPFRLIAEAIAGGLSIPARGKELVEAEKHFTWFTHFASMDCHASGELTRKVMGWTPIGPDLMDDLARKSYFEAN